MNDRLWHNASVIAARYFGSDRGNSGSDADIAKATRLTDAVEKVRSMPPTRNNRINETDFLNQHCAFDADAGFSMLLGDPSQNPFPTASSLADMTISPHDVRIAPNKSSGNSSAIY
jgi:hypothetical protein